MKFWQTLILIAFIAVIGVSVSIWQPWKTSSKTIQVTGEGKIKSTPDVAKIQSGVDAKKPTANEAQTEASSKMAKIIELLKNNGIADNDIKTENISTSPNYNYTDGKSTQDGYAANANITVTIRDLKRGQEILNLLTGNGATNIYGPNLTFSDEKLADIKKLAEAEAVKNAREKAVNLTNVSGAKIGKVVTISEADTANISPMPYALDSLSSSTKSGSSADVIQPGENEITVHVNVTYSLR